MIQKIGFLLVMALILAPVTSSAQRSGTETSIDNLNLADIADDSIVILSKVESGVPGYVNVKYAYVNAVCSDGFQLVDYSGPVFDINDPAIIRAEFRHCSMDDSRDADNDSGSE